MTKKISVTLILSAMLILAGCKQDQDNTKLAPPLYDYIPVNIGHTVVYDVDSVEFNYIVGDTQIVDTIHYQLMVKVIDTFTDQGSLKYSIATYKRYDTTQPFPISVYQASWALVTKSAYELDEQDLLFVKFVFPPVVGINWQGNEYLPANDTVADTYQPYAGWTYTFTSVNVPTTINGMRFDSTAVVTEINTQNLINDALSRETCARHVGLIYKEWEILTKQDVTSGWTYPNQANGFRIRMRIHSYTP